MTTGEESDRVDQRSSTLGYSTVSDSLESRNRKSDGVHGAPEVFTNGGQALYVDGWIMDC